MKEFLFSIVMLIALAVPARAFATTISLLTTPFGAPTALEDFEDASFNPAFAYFASSGTGFASAGAAAGGVTPSGTTGMTTGSFPDPIQITFTSPVFAAGLFFGNDDTCCSTGFSAFLDLYSPASVLLGSVSLAANMNDFADQFLGFTSDTAVGSMVIRYGSGSDVGLFTYIDDVQIGTAAPSAVPEPSTLLLLSGGLVLAARRLRKARA